jgi:hypothetical protein
MRPGAGRLYLKKCTTILQNIDGWLSQNVQNFNWPGQIAALNELCFSRMAHPGSAAARRQTNLQLHRAGSQFGPLASSAPGDSKTEPGVLPSLNLQKFGDNISTNRCDANNGQTTYVL